MHAPGRTKAFKKQISDGAFGRTIRENSSQIRKTNRHDKIMWHRTLGNSLHNVQNISLGEGQSNEELFASVTEIVKNWQNAPSSGSTELLLTALDKIRQRTQKEAAESQKAVKIFLPLGLLPRLVQILQKDSSNACVLIKASEIVQDVAEASGAKAVFNVGLVPILAGHLKHESLKVRHLSVICLGIVAKTTDVNIASLPVIVDGFEFTWNGNIASVDHLQDLAIATAAVLDNKPSTTLGSAIVLKVMNWFQYGVQRRVPPKELFGLVSCLDKIVHCSKQDAVAVCNAAAQSLVDFLQVYPVQYQEDRLLYAILRPAARCIGNITSDKVEETQHIVDCGFLQAARDLVMLGKRLPKVQLKPLRRELFWAMSNVAAGNAAQVTAVMELGDDFLQLIVSSARWDQYVVRMEALWLLSNLLLHSDSSQRQKLVMLDGVLPLCEFLADPREAHVQQNILETIDKLLFDPMHGASYKLLVEENMGLDYIANTAVSGKNQQHVEICCRILSTHFDNTEDPDLAPDESNEVFEFGVSTGLPRKQLFPDGMDTEH